MNAAAPAPNLYQLYGDQLRITYATSGFDGKAHFHYQDASQSVHFTGDEIRTAASEISTLVTVTIFRTIDAGSSSFTLLIPNVNLDQTNMAHITTIGITTLHRFSIIPLFNRGQTEIPSAIPLSGTAEAVAF